MNCGIPLHHITQSPIKNRSGSCGAVINSLARRIAMLWLCTLSIGAVFICAEVRGQTSIVVIQAPDEIIIASDSLAVTTRADGRTSEEAFRKIVPLGNGIFFAAAGNVAAGDSAYQLHKIVKAVCEDAVAEGNTSFDLFPTLIDSAVTDAINQSINKMIPAVRGKLEAETEPFFEYVLFKAERGALRLHYGTFTPKRGFKPDGTRKDMFTMIDMSGSLDCPGQCANDRTELYLGRKQAIRDFINVQKNEWRMEPLERARFLVMLEIIDQPKHVAGPVETLRLKKDGTSQWIKLLPEP